MQPLESQIGVERLLAHSDWARRLAVQLVGDAQQADDLVQEAWLTAIKHPPGHAENLRGWLGRVVRRLAANERRSDRARTRRDTRAARPEALPATDQLVHETELSKELVEVVVAMPEPFKTVLLMRYFRDHKPAQIARELGRPLTTVKTQIQRGLERLRGELDGRYGDRRSWCLALMPLVRRTADSSNVALGAGVWVAAASVLVVGVWSFGGWGGDSSGESTAALEPAGFARALARGADKVSPMKASERVQLGPEESPAPVEEDRLAIAPAIETEAPRGYSLEGILLNLDFSPVAGMKLRWMDSGTLRWKGDSKEVVVGEGTWVPVSAKQREGFRSDALALNAFVLQNFARPELARALLLGEPAPTIETVTDGNGRFHMQLPQRSYNIEIIDQRFGVLGRTKTLDNQDQEQLSWFIAQRRSLGGTVVDAQGEPVASATVIAEGVFPAALRGKLAIGNGLSSRQLKVETDERGRFEFRDVALGLNLMVHAEMGVTVSSHASIQLPDDPAEEAELLTLHLFPNVEQSPSFILEGRVLLYDGSVAPRATVVFGTEATATDPAGNYRLSVGVGQWDLYAARSGSGIAIVHGPKGGQEGGGESLKLADIVLPRASLSIEGRVIDSSGNGVANVVVNLHGGIGAGEGSGLLEDVAAGRSWGAVRTDSTGAFLTGGLADRDYQFSFQSESNRTLSDPIRAGSKGVVFVLP